MSMLLASCQSPTYSPYSASKVPKNDNIKVNNDLYKLEVEITEDSILTDSEDYTPGRWRVLDNGTKVFNLLMGNSEEEAFASGLESEQDIQSAIASRERMSRFFEMEQMIRGSRPVETPPAYQETQFEYTPLNKISSYSSEYKGLVSAVDNPETSARMKRVDGLFYQYKDKVLSLLKADGHSSPSDDIRGSSRFPVEATRYSV